MRARGTCWCGLELRLFWIVALGLLVLPAPAWSGEEDQASDDDGEGEDDSGEEAGEAAPGEPDGTSGDEGETAPVNEAAGQGEEESPTEDQGATGAQADAGDDPGARRRRRRQARRERRSYLDSWADHRFSLNGITPLWESTGNTLEAGRVYAGVGFVQVGLGRGFQVGMRPISFFYAAPNISLRYAPLRLDRVRLALQTEAMVLLSGAGQSFVSSSYQSRIDFWSDEFLVVPVSVAATFQPVDWLNLHPTVTLLGVFNLRHPSARASLGAFLTAEFVVARRHGFFLHVGEVGFWEHEFLMVGASYRFNFRSVELRLGYAYRRSLDGGQGGPLLGFGFRL